MPPRSAVITLAVGIVVVLAAGVTVISMSVKTVALTPAGLLAHYASAIESGDLDEANAVTRSGRAGQDPIGGGALANSADRISAVSTKIISSSDNAAVGRVTFELAGARHTRTVRLGIGLAQLGVLPNWQITAPLATAIVVKVPSSGTATANGVDAPLGQDLRVTVYPGRYAIGLAANNRWFTSSTVSVDAAGPSATVSPVAAPTKALADAVLTQVKKAIDTCVATAVPVPTGCPFSEHAMGSLAGFAWHLDRYPTIAFLDPTHVFLQGGQVTANFVLSYSYIVGKQEADPIAIRGTGVLSFSGSSVMVAIAAG